MTESTTPTRPAQVDLALRAEVESFLYLEARLLGSGQSRAWLGEMVHPEIRYRVSSQQLRSSKDKRYEQPSQVFHFDDDFNALDRRVAQTESGLQWRSDPPETLLYLVSNIEVFRDEAHPSDLRVFSNCVVVRDRRVYESDQWHYRREDSLRRDEGGALKLLSRSVLYGQRFVQGKNLLFFL